MSALNLTEILMNSHKDDIKPTFKTSCSLMNKNFFFYTRNKEEIDFIVNELATSLNLSNRYLLSDLVNSSFKCNKLGSKLMLDYKALITKPTYKPLFCVNIDIGNTNTAKIMIKENDDLTLKTDEFISLHCLNTENVKNKVFNLLKRLYKETMTKRASTLNTIFK